MRRTARPLYYFAVLNLLLIFLGPYLAYNGEVSALPLSSTACPPGQSIVGTNATHLNATLVSRHWHPVCAPDNTNDANDGRGEGAKHRHHNTENANDGRGDEDKHRHLLPGVDQIKEEMQEWGIATTLPIVFYVSRLQPALHMS